MLERFSHGDARLVADLRTTSVQREGLESSIMLERFSHGDARLVADLRTTSVQREGLESSIDGGPMQRDAPPPSTLANGQEPLPTRRHPVLLPTVKSHCLARQVEELGQDAAQLQRLPLLGTAS